MATRIFDIDGTIVNFHTNQWLPGAKEFIRGCYAHGEKIVFMTQRGKKSENKIWGIQMTIALLSELKIEYDIVWDCPSPRIIYNDMLDSAIHHPQNSHWE